MSTELSTHRRSLAIARARIGFPHLLVTTLVLVVATILLGVATKASGAGLACDANWPLCDGGVLNLFPAGFPSFFEWIHRVVAGVAGIFIVASAVLAWRGDWGRAVTWTLIAGMVLTPIQVTLGRETVLSYEMTILNLHFWAAIAIFVCFAVGTILVWSSRLDRQTVTFAMAAASVLVPVQIVFSPLVVDVYSPVIQTMQYAAVLALLFAVLVAAVVGWNRHDRHVAWAVAGTPLLALVVVWFGRESVMRFDPRVDLLYLAVTAFTLVVFAGLAIASRREYR